MLVSVYCPKGHGQALPLTLSDVLIFETGASSEPPMGFDPQPTIDFSEGYCKHMH